MQPNIFTQAAFDNGNYHQKNAFKHVTSTVLYQCTQGSFQNVMSHNPMSHKHRRRSIDIPSESQVRPKNPICQAFILISRSVLMPNYKVIL